jgi:hypothetical protein
MGRSRRRRHPISGQTNQLCIYCQVAETTDSDHVPSRRMFGTPPPPDLITVPSCRPCNQKFGVDDEYFLKLCLDHLAAESPDGAANLENRLKDLQRPESRTKWQAIRDSLRIEVLPTPDGGTVEQHTIRLRSQTILNTTTRIIKRLYYYVTGSSLPLSTGVGTMLYQDFAEQCRDRPTELRHIHDLATEQTGDFQRSDCGGRDIGNGAFVYRYIFLDRETHSSFWFLEFYGRFAFVGSTGQH